MSASHTQKAAGPAETPDAELIRAAKKGDTRAFTTLVRRYEETVYRFAFKMCRDPEKAGETLQDTFVNVFRKLDTFDAKSKFSTWLYTIVANNCLMKQRRRKLRDLEDPLEAYDDPSHDDRGTRRQIPRSADSPAEILMSRELREALDRAIAKLPADYRVVFVLRDMEGNSNEETARILKISLEATKSRLRRARAFLRDELRPYLADNGEGKR
jgi:RNA polymerase sigma-70 factor, ECF subfamily